ncbi:MAG: hypothetical protein IPJ45_05925 [Ignavibacteria bacterium]|nr:hypothetical protein [Ignavibacteria bacterium]
MIGKFGIPMKIYGTHSGNTPLFFASSRNVLNESEASMSPVAKTFPLKTPSLKNIRTESRMMPMYMKFSYLKNVLLLSAILLPEREEGFFNTGFCFEICLAICKKLFLKY